jgi:hypothetical protein
MNEKMSVNVEILGVNTSHNFMVPDDMTVSKVTDLIIKTLLEEYPGTIFKDDISHLLIQESTGKVLPDNFGIKRLGIVNGERLILI